jgi:hypothetical protein
MKHLGIKQKRRSLTWNQLWLTYALTLLGGCLLLKLLMSLL